MPEQQWALLASQPPPEWFSVVKRHAPNSRDYAAQLLWQRGIQTEQQLIGFLNPQAYQPASPFEFGQEMHWAVERIDRARQAKETVAIWGDFDADGVTSTAVLWDGLGQFFPQNTQLLYYIPNRLTESHGLNYEGIERLAKQGTKLIITCDTGSTNISEIEYANSLGLDVIVTDHHTLPAERPPVKAIINPRYLPLEHQMFHLSGVAVAYKLVEALYQAIPQESSPPVEDLLDLVAIGLIADLVQLSGDCRYLAQLGIERLQKDLKQSPTQRRHPGIGRLLELCQKSGDRPTDISFGLGPRINAVSRIQGDASFCVELLTSHDLTRINLLAQDTELANTRRKALQQEVAQQVAKRLTQLDLSTTSIIVLEDSQWSIGVLGLVAGQVAQETNRPTILLSTDTTTSYARGSARSVNQVDLYQLVKDQAHLLHRFGGHPFAAGLSLPVENIPLFAEAINQRLRRQSGVLTDSVLQADLVVTVADLGQNLFRELKLLEPCGMGNPVPKLMLQNCWFENARHQNLQDGRGRKVKYIKTEFDIRDDSSSNSFTGVWWGHYKEELPAGRCDCIAELDCNKKEYQIRLIAVRTTQNSGKTNLPQIDWLLDWRREKDKGLTPISSILQVQECPTNWDELRIWFRRSLSLKQPLALAWVEPQLIPPHEIWLSLVGIAKYLSRTNQTVTRFQLHQKLGIGDQPLRLGFKALSGVGFKVAFQVKFSISNSEVAPTVSDAGKAIEKFLIAVHEEQFLRQYFYQVPLSTIQAIALNTLQADQTSEARRI